MPGWTRKHLVAHVAANADALGNLVHWAATGEPTPMYSSPEERAAGIERGAGMPAAELTAWLRRSAEELAASTASLGDEQWQSPVVTAQGRTVPATELPWMRSREVCVHAIDLGTGLTFADLPTGFLAALCDDVVGKRAQESGPALHLEATDTGASWKLPGRAGRPCSPAPSTRSRPVSPGANTPSQLPAAGPFPPWLAGSDPGSPAPTPVCRLRPLGPLGPHRGRPPGLHRPVPMPGSHKPCHSTSLCHSRKRR